MSDPAGPETTTRLWSCSSLTDGLDALVAQANQCQEQETKIDNLIQDQNIYGSLF